ncbi:MAG: hypothetical protein HY535_00100 [Chloroflexi bacterium]|nr:hypothetical protein [Chloroflexota bacterium]
MEQPFPKRPIFSCEADSFVIMDAEEAANLLRHGHAEPWITLRCGQGNIFETRPQQVLQHQGGQVTVACADGSTVQLDFEDDTANRTTAEGEFVYRGTVHQGNDGLGYLRLR